MSSSDGGSESAESVAALGFLYQAERQDAASILITALALIAGALTYLGVATVAINNANLPGGPWLRAFLAFPLWVVTAFHVLLVGNALVRSTSIEILERRLVHVIGFEQGTRERIGSRAGQRVMNVDEQPAVLKVQTFLSYGGIGAIIVVFTVYCLAVAAKADGWTSSPVIHAAIMYILLFVAALMAWLHVLGLAKEISATSRDHDRARRSLGTTAPNCDNVV